MDVSSVPELARPSGSGLRVALAGLLFLAAACEAQDPSTGDTLPGGEEISERLQLGENGASRDVREAGAIDRSRRTALVRASERVAPAVVGVHTIRQSAAPRSLYEGLFYAPGERQIPGLASGFIIHRDGLVLTNEHVVRDATEILITLPDGREFIAEIVGTDDVNDLALLRVDPRQPLRSPDPQSGADTEADESSRLPVAPLGTSADLMIGEWVVAIGNPFGFHLSNTEPTVTVGVVGGVGRNIIPASGEGGLYLDMIQTDASINPGNSGGPLVNASGEVIGVNSSILSSSGGSEGLGFSIPIDRARRIALDLVDDGEVRRAWVGLEVEPFESGRLALGRRVRVADIAPGSPAEEAGLRPGAELLRVGDRQVRTPLDWQAALLDARVGEPLELTVATEDARREVRVVPDDLPSVAAERTRALEDFELVDLTPAIRAERGLESREGALIVSLSDVARNQLGLREGDLIIGINRTRIRSAQQAAEVLRELAGGTPVWLTFERQGRARTTYFRITG